MYCAKSHFKSLILVVFSNIKKMNTILYKLINYYFADCTMICIKEIYLYYNRIKKSSISYFFYSKRYNYSIYFLKSVFSSAIKSG